MLATIENLKYTKNMLVDEQVAMFLNILAHHHVFYQLIKLQFRHLRETIIRHFN